MATFHRFHQLCSQLIEVSEKICVLRPVEETLTPEEKNGADDPIGDRAGSNHPVGARFAERRRSGTTDLEALEMALRTAMHHAGAVALIGLLKAGEPSANRRGVPCRCGRRARYVELRSKLVSTAVGQVRLTRPYYLCSHCHTGQFPADVEWDIDNTEFSPAVRRTQALVGQEPPSITVAGRCGYWLGWR